MLRGLRSVAAVGNSRLKAGQEVSSPLGVVLAIAAFGPPKPG
jgi:hypothetical protein